MRNRRQTLATLLLCVGAFTHPAMSRAGFMDQFMDPTDGQFDTSDWLLKKQGFLPVPIVITEPAVGYGGGAALVFFHRKQGVDYDPDGPAPRRLPPNVTAVFGAATENGTWAAGGMHFGSWREDHIRYLGGAGYANVNVSFFRGGRSLEFNIEAPLIFQDIEFRLGDSDFFLGGRYQFSDVTATLETGLPNLLPSRNSRIGGLGLVTRFDSRDNIFTPNRGQDATLVGNFYAPALGGTSTWQELEYKLRSFHPLGDRVVLSLRFDGASTWGDVPFYTLPFVRLEGIPTLRYQGNSAGAGEARARWRFYKRWSVVGFFGLGWTAGDRATDDGPFPAGGGGFRYFLARKLGLEAGIDVARGPETTAFYIIVGNAW